MTEDPTCPTCGAIISTWLMDCPCGDEKWTGCAPCHLTPAAEGWAHAEHQSLDLFEAAGL